MNMDAKASCIKLPRATTATEGKAKRDSVFCLRVRCLLLFVPLCYWKTVCLVCCVEAHVSSVFVSSVSVSLSLFAADAPTSNLKNKQTTCNFLLMNNMLFGNHKHNLLHVPKLTRAEIGPPHVHVHRALIISLVSLFKAMTLQPEALAILQRDSHCGGRSHHNQEGLPDASDRHFSTAQHQTWKADPGTATNCFQLFSVAPRASQSWSQILLGLGSQERVNVNVASLDASETGVLHEFPRFSVSTVGREAQNSVGRSSGQSLTHGRAQCRPDFTSSGQPPTPGPCRC